VPRTLLLAQPLRDGAIWAARRSAKSSRDVGAEDRDRSGLPARAVRRAQQQIREAVAHVVGRAPLRRPDAAARTVTFALATVVAKLQPGQPLDLPAARRGAQLVETIPAHALVERKHGFQAGPPVEARGAPDV